MTEDEQCRDFATRMIKNRNYIVCYRYRPDLSLKRRLMLDRYDKQLLLRYQKHFVPRQLR